MLRHADQTFANVVAGNRRILVLQETVRLGVLVDRLRQRGPETGQVRSAVRVRNRIRERKNLIVVAVVILQDDIDEDFVALPRDHDRLRVNDLLVFAELFYELFDAVLVEKRLLFRRIAALISEHDLKARIEEREFTQTRSQPLEFEFRRDGKDRRIGQKRDERAGRFLVLDLADDAQLFAWSCRARSPCDKPCRRAKLRP